MKTKKIYIKGMHCVSCELLLTDEFKKIPGVAEARVSQASNTAILSYKHTLDLEAVKNTAKKFGYDFSESPVAAHRPVSLGQWFSAILVVLAILLAFTVFQQTGLVERLPAAEGGIAWGVAFLVGITASLSTCLVVVGAVVMAFGQRYRSSGTSHFQQVFKPNLLFHAGRLLTFFALGGLLGMIGGQLLISGNTVFIVTAIIASLLFWLGLNTLGFAPSLSRLKIILPARFSAGKWARLKDSDHPWAPLLLGSLSFFLPCGFTQTMQIMALTSGSFTKGALIMFFFALGTTPVLFFLGISSSWIRNQKYVVLQQAIGIILILFSLYTLQSAWALKGVRTSVLANKPAESSVTASATDENTPGRDISPDRKISPDGDIAGEGETTTQNNSAGQVAQEQVVQMSVNSRGFEPRTIQLKKDVPVKWIINGEYVTGCTNNIIIPDLNISKDIKKGLNVVQFTPTKKGKLAFSCWMGMVRGEFVVN